jgi:hypothetical protein
MTKAALTIALLALALPALANPFGYLTALVPLNPGSAPGAFGAQWTTTLWASNNSDSDVKIACQTLGDPCLTLKAHATMAVPQQFADLTHPGFFVSVPMFFIGPNAVPPNGVSFDLRVTDSVTAPHSEGTEIPLVRPNDFAQVVLIASVPLNGHSRSKLRIYGLANGSATIRATGNISNRDLLNTTVTLAGADAPGPAMRFPSYAEIDLPSGIAPDDTAMRVEIDGTVNVWGFVSVTDDETQQFTIVTPQPMQYIPLSLA